MSDEQPGAPIRDEDPCAAVELRRATVKAKRERARIEQRRKDLEAIADIEDETGLELKTLETQDRYVDGAPTVVAVRPPSKAEYNRYNAQMRGAKDNVVKRGDATDLLAKTCLVYPKKDSDEARALFEHFPGTLNSVLLVVTKLAELQSEDEKKG